MDWRAPTSTARALAKAAGAGNRTWHAYLSASASGNQPAVNARDRIGKGPWSNAKGVRIAQDVDDLHSDKNNLTRETQLTEKGENPPRHDILTGSQLDGRAYPRAQTGRARIGRAAATGRAGLAITTAGVEARIRPRGIPRTIPRAAARTTCEAPAATACSTASPRIDASGFGLRASGFESEPAGCHRRP